MSQASVHLSIAGRSDLGHCRKNNEDAMLIADVAGGRLLRGDAPSARFDVGERGVLLVVSDGMGGESAGEVASAVVVESFARAMVGAPADMPGDAQIEGAIQAANRDVLLAAQQDGREGMGATLTAVFVQACATGATAFIAEVGDSRAYLLRSGQITRLTKDQSYVQLLVDRGVLDPKQAEESPLHNVILQAMGRQGGIQAELGKLELRCRDCLLLCSDGLSNAVGDDELLGVVLASSSLEQACASLVDLANGRGGKDNITVMLAGVGGDLAPASVGGTRREPPVEILASFVPRPQSSRSRRAVGDGSGAARPGYLAGAAGDRGSRLPR